MSTETIENSLNTNNAKCAPVALRTGAEYLRSLDDGRSVYVDGEKVQNITKHPAFAEAARSASRLYDIAADPAMSERMTFTSPKSGGPVLRAYQIPRSLDDLRQKRIASETWSEATFGMVGRTPDHVAGFFCGYAAVPELFAAGGSAIWRQCSSLLRALKGKSSVGDLCYRSASDRSFEAGAQAGGSRALCWSCEG